MSAPNFEPSASPGTPRTFGAQNPTNILELRAAEQRRRVHNAVSELRQTVRERIDVKRLARQHVWTATGAAAAVGLLVGYGAGGIFTR